MEENQYEDPKVLIHVFTSLFMKSQSPHSINRTPKPPSSSIKPILSSLQASLSLPLSLLYKSKGGTNPSNPSFSSLPITIFLHRSLFHILKNLEEILILVPLSFSYSHTLFLLLFFLEVFRSSLPAILPLSAWKKTKDSKRHIHYQTQ